MILMAQSHGMHMLPALKKTQKCIPLTMASPENLKGKIFLFSLKFSPGIQISKYRLLVRAF